LIICISVYQQSTYQMTIKLYTKHNYIVCAYA